MQTEQATWWARPGLGVRDGRLLIAGHNVATESGAVRQCVGIIFQNPSLDVNLTAEENVRLHAILYGLYPFAPNFALMPRAYQAQIHTLAGVLGIDQEIFKPIKTFSGGMKRKLEIIRSLIHRPQVLFLDEPTSGLDPASRRSLWEYLGQVRAEYQTTIFLTTHYLEEAEQADRICILNAGKVVINDTPAQVKANLIENYVLIDAAQPGELRAELERRGIPFTETPQFKIDLAGIGVHQLLKTIDTPLTLVQVHTPTVEDAYLSILERE